MRDADEHERTMVFAEIAFGQMKALRQPATPRNYEIWYTYATGYNPSLNQTINEKLARNNNLSKADLEEVYSSYLSPTRLSERIDKVGSRVEDEIAQVMAMIEAASGSATSYGESLAGASAQIGQAKNPEGLRAIVESLVQTTNEMQQANTELEKKLNASKQQITQLQQNLQVVRAESQTDPLTGVANRKYFDETLAKAITHHAVNDEPLSLLMLDIDHFKTFNDTYGHLTGDQVLRVVAIEIKHNIKGQDTAARYGGEEFAIILPNTALRSAITVGEQIRRATMAKELKKRSTGQVLGRITISLGVASLHKGDTPQSLIARADACLYAAKRHGRNRVISESDPEFLSPEEKVA